MITDNNSSREAARLCLDCGLCCNGVLFDLVMLQPGDHAKALSARGLKIKKGDRFNQPCTALCGVLCGIYEHRPVRCRTFVCRQFQLVAAGETPPESALERIREAKENVGRVEVLLEEAGGSNPRKPLAHRVATVMGRGAAEQSAPATNGMAGAAAQDAESGASNADSHPDLTQAMAQLQQFLARHFRLP